MGPGESLIGSREGIIPWVLSTEVIQPRASAIPPIIRGVPSTVGGRFAGLVGDHEDVQQMHSLVRSFRFDCGRF